VNTHDFTVRAADGTGQDLRGYAGRVLLIVNVASQCGFTPQYAGLESLYRGGQHRGLLVLGFPCDQFGGQEPGTDAEIQEFCSTTYQVTFPVLGKIEVNGPGADPLYVYLRAQAPGNLGPADGLLYQHLSATRPEAIGTDEIKWNFTKFLVDRKGKVIERYAPNIEPQAIAADIEKLL